MGKITYKPPKPRTPATGQNKVGCCPDDDVCLEHSLPLVCKHGCEEAAAHRCEDR